MSTAARIANLSIDKQASLFAVAKLTSTEVEAYKLRHGFADGFSHTFDEVAAALNGTNAEIVEIIDSANQKLSDYVGIVERDMPLGVYLDPGSASAEQIAELLTELSRLYRMLGGSGISFARTDIEEPVVV